MARPDPDALLLLMHDDDHTDPATVSWGDFGGWMYWGWDELEPTEGNYAWATVDAYLAAADALGKKSALSIMLYPAVDGDATPAWVYAKDTTNLTGKGWPIEINGVDTGQTFPGWYKPYWNYYYQTLVEAFADRYNGDPRIHSVWICTSVAGETIEEDLGDNTHGAGNFFRWSVELFDDAFPDVVPAGLPLAGNPGTPLAMIHSGVGTRRELALLCYQHNICSKMNVLGEDANNHVYDPPWLPGPGSGTAQVAFYATQTLGNWMSYEHG